MTLTSFVKYVFEMLSLYSFVVVYIPVPSEFDFFVPGGGGGSLNQRDLIQISKLHVLGSLRNESEENQTDK